MGMKIELNRAALADLSGAIGRAAELTADKVLEEVRSAQVMPFDNGIMQDTNTFISVQNDGPITSAHIVTDAPQARRLYFNPQYDFQKGNNPNAGGKWLEPWLTGDRAASVADIYAEILKEEAGL